VAGGPDAIDTSWIKAKSKK